MPGLVDRQPNQKHIVAALAAQCRVPINEVATLYEHERAVLAADAHVTKFLHIFAIRNVREMLSKRVLGTGHTFIAASYADKYATSPSKDLNAD